MLSKLKMDIISYLVVCVEEFAIRFNLSEREAFNYLNEFGGISFLQEHYEIEHTLDLDNAIEDLSIICRKNGGQIQ